jgi:hypothetical protein
MNGKKQRDLLSCILDIPSFEVRCNNLSQNERVHWRCIQRSLRNAFEHGIDHRPQQLFLVSYQTRQNAGNQKQIDLQLSKPIATKRFQPNGFQNGFQNDFQDRSHHGIVRERHLFRDVDLAFEQRIQRDFRLIWCARFAQRFAGEQHGDLIGDRSQLFENERDRPTRLARLFHGQPRRRDERFLNHAGTRLSVEFNDLTKEQLCGIAKSSFEIGDCDDAVRIAHQSLHVAHSLTAHPLRNPNDDQQAPVCVSAMKRIDSNDRTIER